MSLRHADQYHVKETDVTLFGVVDGGDCGPAPDGYLDVLDDDVAVVGETPLDEVHNPSEPYLTVSQSSSALVPVAKPTQSHRRKYVLLAVVLVVAAGIGAAMAVMGGGGGDSSGSAGNNGASSSTSVFGFTITCGAEGDSSAACGATSASAPASCCAGHVCAGNKCTLDTAPTYPLTSPAGAVVLPPSSSDGVLRLVANQGTATEATIARSWNGMPWEPVRPITVNLTCIQATCAATLQDDGTVYTVDAVSAGSNGNSEASAPIAKSASAKAARLLTQASFGPTRAAIDHVLALGSPEAWVREQMDDLPPTLLREYFRARASPTQLTADRLGALRPACEAGSRWQSFALQRLDTGKTLTIEASATPDYLALSLSSVVVTELANTVTDLSNGSYVICELAPGHSTGSAVTLQAASAGGSCANGDDEPLLTLPNPPIEFVTPAVAATALDFDAATLAPHPFLSDVKFLEDLGVSTCDKTYATSMTFMRNGGVVYRHDPRIKLLTNTLKDSSQSESGDADGNCPSVHRTFLNEAFCQQKPSCAATTYNSAAVALDEETLRIWYESSNRFVYYMANLRLEGDFRVSPCLTTYSRWRRYDNATCPAPTDTLRNATLAAMRAALGTSLDTNPYVRDIDLRGDVDCMDDGEETIGAQVQVGTTCFEHVHPDAFGVRDFTYWVANHDGNDDAADNNRPNPIAKWAEQGLTYIAFPGDHPMTRWTLRQENMPLIGRLGDVVDFAALGTELQTTTLADHVGAASIAGDGTAEVCGSPGEVTNVPRLGHLYHVPKKSDPAEAINTQTDYKMLQNNGKTVLWSSVALKAEDQLRQRVAWALSEILVASAVDVGLENLHEPWAAYYDIFVRHAFGNYRDILREVSYSPVMGDYLTYRQSQGFGFNKKHPDENYAREIMQLFSIGLTLLGDDGLPLPEDEESYDNDNIFSFARIWTGFDAQAKRANAEYMEKDVQDINYLDPMQIKPEWRDKMPKIDLSGGFIGDGYPLCHELPPQEFLLKGAHYELTAEESIEGNHVDTFHTPPDEIFKLEDGAASNRINKRTFLGSVVGRFVGYSRVTWTIQRDRDETVTMRAWYYVVNNNWHRPLRVTVNGVVVAANWNFPDVAGSSELQVNNGLQIELKAGTNTIAVGREAGGSSVDLSFISFGGDGGVRPRLELNPESSQLHQALCAPDAAAGTCTFPAQVTLPSTLPCDGIECQAGRVLSVAVTDRVRNIRYYYHHQVQPCVRLALFDTGSVVQRSASSRQCSPRNAPHSVLCCKGANYNTIIPINITSDQQCLYANEAVSYAVAEARCSALGGGVCQKFTSLSQHSLGCAEQTYIWTRQTCSPTIEVYLEGYVGLIDPEVEDLWQVRPNSDNSFRVHWEDLDAAPRASNGCGAGCTVTAVTSGTDRCICNVTVSESVLYANVSDVPSVEEVAATLFVGTLPPGVVERPRAGAAAYAVAATTADGVVVWTPGGVASPLDRHTILELPPRTQGGTQRFRLNRVSMVTVDGQPDARFRNPPTFMPLLGEQFSTQAASFAHLTSEQLLPQAEHEVEALLDHLFEHQNVAPFVSLRLIQQMVTSNPSPSYVRRVTTAFRSGTYDAGAAGGGSIGSGKYGDLGATVAAVLLDKEARTPELDADPTFGHGFEPLLKVIAILRALEWNSSVTSEVMLTDLQDRLGMEPFNTPSVFGYYLPEYAATGAIQAADLVSPELALVQSPLVMNYLNGMVSLVDKGLSSCDDGFGTLCETKNAAAGYEGALSWKPSAGAAGNAAAVIDELSLLLTQDRLTQHSRAVIADAYDKTMLETNSSTEALKKAQKLMLSVPEFHASSAGEINDVQRDRSSGGGSASGNASDAGGTGDGRRPFKAIVVMMLSGGADSFNMLIPHSRCADGKDMYEEYATVRTDGAIPKSRLLPVDVPEGTQPCDTFGLHYNLGGLKQLMEDGDGAWVANIGSLVEPLNRSEYFGSFGVPKKKRPPRLFAHNTVLKYTHSMIPTTTQVRTGWLGRMVKALRGQDNPYKCELFSVSGSPNMLTGAGDFDIIVNSQVKGFDQFDALGEELFNLTGNASTSKFADKYSEVLHAALKRTSTLGPELAAAQLDTTFGSTGWQRSLERVAKLVKLRDKLGTERAVFFANYGGFDNQHMRWGSFHPKMADLSAGVSKFVQEMKKQGVWDDVVLVTMSEFGRKLTSNGRGCDHAWGGNHFLAGGKIKGGRILGRFPNKLTDDYEYSVNQGRLIPTTPWEGIMGGLAEWFGLEPQNMQEVFPVINRFPSDMLYSAGELFGDASATNSSAEATQFGVDWAVPASPDTLTVGQAATVTFSWSGYHDLVQTQTAACNFDGMVTTAPASDGASFDWTPPGPGTYHFACSVGSHCANGMKITIVVE
eukprot:m.16891 g.16891  ORF g.16891 m.16891 type:complete len:2374 (-) comp5352_c0_seq1:24-7145(-)